MEEHEKRGANRTSDSPTLFEQLRRWEDHEKEGAIYILGTIGLVALILILVSLTHVLY
jgi:hypothetical protein